MNMCQLKYSYCPKKFCRSPRQIQIKCWEFYASEESPFLTCALSLKSSKFKGGLDEHFVWPMF